ncbi:MAG: glycosyltransferase family 2 protein [Bacteroidales bacterium]
MTSKISIITPSFNQGQFLEETILSVINQRDIDLEYFIIDGGSTDNTIEIIKKYEHKLNFWVSEQDKGQSEAINKGLIRATGNIVAWLNSDDLYVPDTLRFVSDFFEKNPDIDLLYGDVINFYDNGKAETFRPPEFNPVSFLKRVNIHQPSVFWRRSILKQTGLLDESLHYLMDYDLWVRIFFSFKTQKVNKALSKFRIHSGSKTNDNPPGVYMEFRKIFSRFIYSLNRPDLIELLKSVGLDENKEKRIFNFIPSISESVLSKIMNNYIFNCAIQEYTFGSKSRANNLLIKSLKFSRLHSFLYFYFKNNLR